MASSSSATHYEQGKLFYQHKKFEDAIKEFTLALKRGPETKNAAGRCYNARGVVHFYLGEFKNVIKDCTRALEMDPDNANYHNCRGNAFFSLGKFAKASEDFTAAINLSPNVSHGRYFNNRGSAYRRLKMFNEAIDDYSRAIDVDEKNGNYYNNRGNTHFDMGEFQKAIDDFTIALGLEPYSPKTKLTLAQAHEALAQEKRMKNKQEYKGRLSSLKKKNGTVKRKEKECQIFVSPAGIEVVYEKGWRKKKKQSSFAWSEEMKIQLINDSTVRLYLDSGEDTWLEVVECQGTQVEEDLIGRITHIFQSYSTACLVAQHEDVCNDYAAKVKSINEDEKHLAEKKLALEAALEQQQQFSNQDDFRSAEQAQSQVNKLKADIARMEERIEQAKVRAENVRVKAHMEAGPVCEMVRIMKVRVRELYHSKFKHNTSGQKYEVQDLNLEEQLNKMEALLARARELEMVVSQPLSKIQSVLEGMDSDEDDSDFEYDFDSNDDDDGEDDEGNVQKPAPPATKPPRPSGQPPKPAPPTTTPPQAETKATEPEPEATEAKESDSEPEAAAVTESKSLEDYKEDSESDISDWDDLDDVPLPEAFAVKGEEIFMTVENPLTGMMTITPVKQAENVPGEQRSQVVMMNKGSLEQLTSEQKAAEEKLVELEAKTEEEVSTMTDEERQAYEARLKELEAKAGRISEVEQEKAQALQELEETNASLNSIQQESERIKAQLEAKIAEMEAASSNLGSELHSSAEEQAQLKRLIQDQQDDVKYLKTQLDGVNSALERKVEEAAKQAEAASHLEGKNAELSSKIADMQSRIEAEREARSDKEAKLEELMGKSTALESKLSAMEQEKKEMAQKMDEQFRTMADLRRHLAQMQADLEAANEEKRRQASAVEEARKEQQEALKHVQKLKVQAVEEEKKRRKLHNMIQEIKGNIRVYVRHRPDLANANNGHQLYKEVVGSDGRGLQVIGLEEKSNIGGESRSKQWDFEFDRVFGPESTQEVVFDEISQLVQSALDGFKVSIFAYGQTGSGKTYTMEGPDNPTAETRGVIPRAVAHIFHHRETMADKGWTYTCEVAFLEIYNKIIRDLLADEGPDVTEHDHKIVMAREGKKTATVVENLSWHPVDSADDLQPLLEQANGNRSTAATQSNDRSSRSHSVFTMKIHGFHAESKTRSLGVLNLVDLAGSERIAKSGVEGKQLEETKNINSSLTCLGDVIAALAQGQKHVPFRNSKLTYLLQDSFGGGSKTLMFINLAGEVSHLSETLCSLRFGAKVHNCHIGQGKKQISRGGSNLTNALRKAVKGSKKKAGKKKRRARG